MTRAPAGRPAPKRKDLLPMRWFTDEARIADEAGWAAVLAAYEAHVAEILDDLPRDLAAFATDPRLHLHDARFVSVLVDQDVETVEMVVARMDDSDLRLKFGDAAFIEDDLQAIAYAVGGRFVTDHWGTTRTIILDQEVDIVEAGRFLLRLRLWPFHEFGLTFRAFSLTEEPASIDSGAPGLLVFAGDTIEDDATA